MPMRQLPRGGDTASPTSRSAALPGKVTYLLIQSTSAVWRCNTRALQQGDVLDVKMCRERIDCPSMPSDASHRDHTQAQSWSLAASCSASGTPRWVMAKTPAQLTGLVLRAEAVRAVGKP